MAQSKSIARKAETMFTYDIMNVNILAIVINMILF